jgi:glycosyltransferase involved in cell wall biosynthesis
MNSRKILIISSSAHSLITFRWHLLQDLINSGYDVVTCVPLAKIEEKDKKLIVAALNKIGVKIINIELNNTGLNPFSDIMVFLKLIALVKEENPNIVLNYMIKPVMYGSLAAKIGKIKYIYSVITGLGYVFIGDSLKIKIIRFLVKSMYKVVLKYNTKVFFQNSDDLNLFINSKLLARKNAVLIHGSGVDINEFSPSPFPKTCTFLLAARLLRDKGIYEYIEAARQIKSTYPEVKFLLAGDIDNNPSALTKKELNDLINEGIIEYLGWVKDIGEILRKTSVFVLPSYREGTSRAVLEAMASGRPIITTDAPGCRHTVENRLNGYLVEVKNIEQLVSAMEKFVLYPELMAQMGRESRRIAVEKYDVCKVNQTILESIAEA